MITEREKGPVFRPEVMKGLARAFVSEIPGDNIANVRGLLAFMQSADLDTEPQSPDMVRGRMLVMLMLDIFIAQIEGQLTASPSDKGD